MDEGHLPDDATFEEIAARALRLIQEDLQGLKGFTEAQTSLLGEIARAITALNERVERLEQSFRPSEN